MPHPHATIEAMRAGWYVRDPAHNAPFTMGPYPSREDAMDEGPVDLKLKPGQPCEVGLLVPFVPRIDAAQWLLTVADSALSYCGPAVTEGWVHTLSTLDPAPLEEALNLVLKGWLSANESHPNFGMIAEAHTFTTPQP
jgi:hypothetical protein